MGDKILKFDWLGKIVDMKVDVDKCTLLDLVVDYEEEGKKRGLRLDYHYPTFAYVFDMKHHYLITDKDLMLMFERTSSKPEVIIWVGTVLKPNALYKLVLNLKRQNEKKKKNEEIIDNVASDDDDLPSLDDLEDTFTAVSKSIEPRKKAPSKCMVSKKKGKSKVASKSANDDADLLVNDHDADFTLDDLDETTATVSKCTDPQQKPSTKGNKPKKQVRGKAKPKSGTVNLPPPPVSPKTAFQSLPMRRSPRFSPAPNTTITAPVCKSSSQSDLPMFTRKIPKTTARRKGISTIQQSGAMSTTAESVVDLGESSKRVKSVKRKVEFRVDADETGAELDEQDAGDHDVDDESDSEEDINPKFPLSDDEGDIMKMPKIKDNWKPGQGHDFIDELDDNDYYQTLYKNGELYEDKEFGKIVLRPWMLFLDKSHFRDTLKDYCVQEGFAINVLATDNKRYSGTCYAQCCGWRIHASVLGDGVTWAIKKIDPNVHSCRGLEVYNPICNAKWAAAKLLEDIRANPDIPGKALNELLFQRYGVYMKKTSLYRMKKYVVDKLFGGHDASYSDLPAYTRIICETNPDSKAFCGHVESESIPRTLLFDRIFISLAAMWKGFLSGCRPLIGVDGTHLKGNYGGVLLSAVSLDANNEIFPIAYAVVSVEDRANWSYFMWNLYQIVTYSNRSDWTIISDRQKVFVYIAKFYSFLCSTVILILVFVS